MFSSFTHYRWNVAILGKVDIQVDLAWEFMFINIGFREQMLSGC